MQVIQTLKNLQKIYQKIIDKGVLIWVKKFTADFETNVNENDCRVWAWAVVEVDNIEAIEYGNRIETFIDWLKSHTGTAVYFHNLKFDGMFIMDWLLKHDWSYHYTGKNMEAGEFNSLISDMGQWYMMKLCIKGTGKHREFVTIYDSLKLLPYSVEKIADAFNLTMLKGEIDYNAYREVGHELTDEEKIKTEELNNKMDENINLYKKSSLFSEQVIFILIYVRRK